MSPPILCSLSGASWIAPRYATLESARSTSHLSSTNSTRLTGWT